MGVKNILNTVKIIYVYPMVVMFVLLDIVLIVKKQKYLIKNMMAGSSRRLGSEQVLMICYTL